MFTYAGEYKKWLDPISGVKLIDFGDNPVSPGSLRFYDLKRRGDGLLQIKMEEVPTENFEYFYDHPYYVKDLKDVFMGLDDSTEIHFMFCSSRLEISHYDESSNRLSLVFEVKKMRLEMN